MAQTRKRKCCVLDCFDTDSKRHRFPLRDEQIFDAWVQIIKPKGYMKMTKRQIYNNYLVCHRHFAAEDQEPGNQRGLMRRALPELFLPVTNPTVKTEFESDANVEPENSRVIEERNIVIKEEVYYETYMDYSLE